MRSKATRIKRAAAEPEGPTEHEALVVYIEKLASHGLGGGTIPVVRHGPLNSSPPQYSNANKPLVDPPLDRSIADLLPGLTEMIRPIEGLDLSGLLDDKERKYPPVDPLKMLNYETNRPGGGQSVEDSFPARDTPPDPGTQLDGR